MQLLVALMALLPSAVSADDAVQLAKWTFDTGYTVEANVYTPNSDDWAAIGWNGFGTLPTILPNECEGTQTDYYVSAKGTRFWGIQNNNGDRILSLYQDMDPNNISDYTDATQHNQYFEVGFPTKGYKNVHFIFSYTCGDNKVRALEAVVSTDGGQTWSDAGAYESGTNWWIYKTNDMALSANDKDQVIVRLIAPNDETAQWRMNDISITAEKAEGPVAVNEKGVTATWELKSTTVETNATTSVDGLFSVAALSWGEKIEPMGLRTDGDITRQQFQPTETAQAGDDNAAIVFTLKPKKSLSFAPKSLSFNASRVGTNGGKFDVVVISGNEELKVAEGVTPQLAKESPFISNHTFDLSGMSATDDALTVKIYVYSLANNKQYAFSDVVITGDVEGTLEPVPTYTLSVTSAVSGAGKVSTTPAGAEFDEGTIITASATENFGYHFQGWANEVGEIVSTDKNYTFEISENTSLTAQYVKANVYALNLTRSEGVAENLVQYQPVGNYVDGIHYYEEGTDVVLTAVNNRIMTFTGWDGDATGTSQTCEVKMTGEKNVTANFSAVDYIVGWDLYYDQPAKDRAADYKADSENAGMLSLRKADGTTNGWLTRGSSNGQENGKYAARIWKFLSEEWYFEISFSSKGYENLVISSCLGDDYNTYSENNVEYSIDGTNFTKIGTFNPPARAWDGPKEFALPEDANDQDRVWIRWMPNRESDLVGVTSDYDGTSIAEIFVLADQKEGAVKTPILVSSTPAEGSTDASANGSIILNFDAKVKAGTGNAILNGEEIAPVIAGKSAVFKYAGLDYATQYTFQMPKGVLVSRSGEELEGVNITFTTMERQQPEKRVFDAIVAQDGSGDYTTVQDAIDAAPAGRGKPWLIFIKNGQYKEHVDVPATKPYLHFIGQSRDGVVIKDDRLSGGDNAVHVSVGATVVVNASNTFFESLTMENIYGHEKQNGPQALALNTGGDRIALNNVALLSYQDTWITTSTSNNRHYIKNSLIEGAVDFIYNSGNVYLDGDTLEINRPSGGYIVAPSHGADVKWGYVFQNNVLRAHPGVNVTDIWLGRPWHNQPKTVFINLQTFINIPAKGWYETMGGLPVLWADYNTVDANGNPVDLSQRESYYYYVDSSTGDKVEAFNVKNYLTDEEAAQYTIKNVMGGDDNWQPDLLCEATEAPAPVFNDNTISWEEVPYAICYVVTRGDEVVAITTETSVDVNAVVSAKGSAALGANDSEEPYKVQSVNEQGGLSKFGIATDATALNAVSAAKGAKSNVYYNIAGQRVNSSFKGMVISDGKKYMK
ncbi:MAG: Ig-like domain-containing protein [Prevotella sp.]|nr:Ig-like domain-containing protein [Prevotella sp.]